MPKKPLKNKSKENDELDGDLSEIESITAIAGHTTIIFPDDTFKESPELVLPTKTQIRQSMFRSIASLPESHFEEMFGELLDQIDRIEHKNRSKLAKVSSPREHADLVIKELAKIRTPLWRLLNEDTDEDS